jgi:nucleoside-diphosphate-sugar epimerase
MNPARITLLVTGATGFLGSAIAADLLENHPAVDLLFLVRAGSAEEGLRRLREKVAVMTESSAALARLKSAMILCGDLELFPALLGDARVQSITHVLNSAALASFAWKKEVWTVNVDHTTAFAKAIATLPAMRRFLYVGTAMISGNTEHQSVQEDQFPSAVRQFVPYTRSKAEIERLLPELLGPVPCVVARPSIVVGHTRLGCRPSPSIFWIFRMIHAARKIPFPAHHRIDVIPVDYCARALIHLTLKPELQQTRYHVSAGSQHSCTFAAIDRAYSRVKNEENIEPLAEFDVADLPGLEPQFNAWFGPGNSRHLLSAIHIYRAFAGLNVTFDNQRLLVEGMEAPPTFADYLDVCIRTGEADPIAEQMLCDFR